MLSFLLRRLGQAILVVLAVGLLSFVMFRFVGDPVQSMSREDATVQEKQDLRESLGLDDPVPIQFAAFVGRALHGNFGVSYRNQRPVSDLITERLPATLELVFAATVLALVIGIPLGVITAIRPKGALSNVVQAVSLVGVSTPTFVTGIMLILLFAVTLRWLPSFGRGETTDLGWWSTGFLTGSGWRAIVLPSLTLALFQMTLIMRLVRAEMIEILQSDYIRFARARGLPKGSIHYRLALKNALMPVLTITGMQIGGLIAFAIVTESVFQWPGMGLLFIQAVQFVDVPVMAAYLMFVGLVFVALNAIVDITYAIVDPRLRVQG
ncbi:MAG: ABC transporter permease [Silicimonas sp.]|nr:ABC transporter permease [Silicimonas sp.]